MRKTLSSLTNGLLALIQGIEQFASMAIFNAVISLMCLCSGWRLGAITFGIFGIIWGLVALFVALKKQHEAKKKAAQASAGDPKLS